MSTQRNITLNFRIHINRKILSWGLAALVICAAVYGLFSDTLTMTAYYPSPQGIYWKLWSTADAIFGRDTVTTGAYAVQVGGDSTKNLYNKTTSQVLGVWGNVDINTNQQNFPASGVLNIQNGKGILLPTTASTGGACSTTVGADANGNLYGCNTTTGKWVGVGGSNIVSGTNPTCPAGTAPVTYYWSSRTCVGQNNTGRATTDADYQTCYAYCPLGCPTNAGWSSVAPTCQYASSLSFDQWTDCICGSPKQTCTATSWTKVQCL